MRVMSAFGAPSAHVPLCREPAPHSVCLSLCRCVVVSWDLAAPALVEGRPPAAKPKPKAKGKKSQQKKPKAKPKLKKAGPKRTARKSSANAPKPKRQRTAQGKESRLLQGKDMTYANLKNCIGKWVLRFLKTP